MLRTVTFSILAPVAVVLAGCDEQKAPSGDNPQEAVVAPTAAPIEEAEEKAAERTAAEEPAQEAEQESETPAEAVENLLAECCRALGKKGFTERIIEYSSAARACGKELDAEKDLKTVLSAIEKELDGKPLLDECKVE